MEKILKEQCTINEAAEHFSNGDDDLRGQIVKYLDSIYAAEIFQTLVGLREKRGHGDADFDQARYFFRTSREEVSRFVESVFGNEQAKEERPKYLFKKTDKGYFMIFDGEEIELPNKIGYAYLLYCMEHNNEEGFSSEELEVNVKGILPYHPPNTKQQAIDDKARKQYLTELENLNERIREADQNNDGGLSQLQQNRISLIGQLNQTTRAGRIKLMPDENSKALNRVSKAMKEAIEGLSKSEIIYSHFERAFKPFANYKKYYPPEPLPWKFE